MCEFSITCGCTYPTLSSSSEPPPPVSTVRMERKLHIVFLKALCVESPSSAASQEMNIGSFSPDLKTIDVVPRKSSSLSTLHEAVRTFASRYLLDKSIDGNGLVRSWHKHFCNL